MWHDMHGYWGWGGWIIGFFILFVIIWIISRSVKINNSKPNNTALDILKQRYVRGKISREEYLEKKKDLTTG